MTRTVEVNPLKRSQLSSQVVIPASLNVLEDGQSLAQGHSLFRILTAKDGDKRVVWDSRDLDQISDAKAMFDDLVSQGMVPYIVGGDGVSTGIVMDEFDPAVEEVIFLPVGKEAGLLAGG